MSCRELCPCCEPSTVCLVHSPLRLFGGCCGEMVWYGACMRCHILPLSPHPCSTAILQAPCMRRAPPLESCSCARHTGCKLHVRICCTTTGSVCNALPYSDLWHYVAWCDCQWALMGRECPTIAILPHSVVRKIGAPTADSVAQMPRHTVGGRDAVRFSWHAGCYYCNAHAVMPFARCAYRVPHAVRPWA